MCRSDSEKASNPENGIEERYLTFNAIVGPKFQGSRRKMVGTEARAVGPLRLNPGIVTISWSFGGNLS